MTVFLFNPFKNAGLQTTVAVVMPGTPAVPRLGKQKTLCVLGVRPKFRPANVKCCHFIVYSFPTLNDNNTGAADDYRHHTESETLSDKG